MTINWDVETEFVVLGAGGCGLTAAFAAAKQGIDVMLLEKNSRHLSNTEISSGSIAAAGTRLQNERGIEDSPEQMAADVMRKNKGHADPEIVQALCVSARDVVHMIIDEVGLPLELNTDAGRAGQSSLRLHNPPGRTGERLVRAYHDALARYPNFTFADFTPGIALVTDDEGAVIGVVAGEESAPIRIGASKVLLATCGFGANREMLNRYIPTIADADYIGAQGASGDGILAGIAVGAATDHMAGYQAHGFICARYGTRLAPEIPFLGGIIVDGNARRFVREDQGYSEFAPIVLAQPEGTAIEIFDQRIYDILIPTVHFQETVEAGALRRGNTIEDLAIALHLDPAALCATMGEYREIVASGIDPLGRELIGPALEPPYYGAVITGALAHTQGGLRVDKHARVLRDDGSIIRNLYAGGGAAAGISGDGPEGYLSGNGLLTALSFGLIAGEHAVAALRGKAGD